VKWSGSNSADYEEGIAKLLYIAPNKNPLGLIIEISIYRDIIHHIRFSTSTSEFSPTQEELELFKDTIRKTRAPESWVLKKRSVGDTETYDDPDIRTVLFINGVVIHSHTIGPPR